MKEDYEIIEKYQEEVFEQENVWWRMPAGTTLFMAWSVGEAGKTAVTKSNQELIVPVGLVISDLPSNFLFLNSTVSKRYRTPLEI